MTHNCDLFLCSGVWMICIVSASYEYVWFSLGVLYLMEYVMSDRLSLGFLILEFILTFYTSSSVTCYRFFVEFLFFPGMCGVGHGNNGTIFLERLSISIYLFFTLTSIFSFTLIFKWPNLLVGFLFFLPRHNQIYNGGH